MIEEIYERILKDKNIVVNMLYDLGISYFKYDSDGTLWIKYNTYFIKGINVFWDDYGFFSFDDYLNIIDSYQLNDQKITRKQAGMAYQYWENQAIQMNIPILKYNIL